MLAAIGTTHSHPPKATSVVAADQRGLVEPAPMHAQLAQVVTLQTFDGLRIDRGAAMHLPGQMPCLASLT